MCNVYLCDWFKGFSSSASLFEVDGYSYNRKNESLEIEDYSTVQHCITDALVFHIWIVAKNNNKNWFKYTWKWTHAKYSWSTVANPIWLDSQIVSVLLRFFLFMLFSFHVFYVWMRLLLCRHSVTKFVRLSCCGDDDPIDYVDNGWIRFWTNLIA